MAILLGHGAKMALAAETEPKTTTQPEPREKSILPPEAGAWVTEVESWGGYFPMVHGARITSDGKVETRTGCRAQLLKADLGEIELAVSSAKPSGWKAHYPVEIYDPFSWSLRLHRREADNSEQTYRTSGKGTAGLPGDLEAVRKAAREIWNDVQKRCRDLVGRPPADNPGNGRG
jgi:hypothetical protein